MEVGEVEEVGRIVGMIARRCVERMEEEGMEGGEEFVRRNGYFVGHEEEGKWKGEICSR